MSTEIKTLDGWYDKTYWKARDEYAGFFFCVWGGAADETAAFALRICSDLTILRRLSDIRI